MRENTERPITLSEGTNVMVGRNPERIAEEALQVLNCHGRLVGAQRCGTVMAPSESLRTLEQILQGYTRWG